jgi:hypothetical protein
MPIKHSLDGGDGLTFSIAGIAGQPSAMKWVSKLVCPDLAQGQFLVIEYRAQWLWRERAGQEVLAATVAEGKSAPRTVPLVLSAEILDDGRWHKLIARRVPSGASRELIVALDSRDSRTYLQLRSIRFTTSPEEIGPSPEAASIVRVPNGLATIDLSDQYSASYRELVGRLLARAEDPVARDAGSYFATPLVTVGDLPFRVQPQGKNLVCPSPEPSANQEWIDNYGLRVQRGRVAPISRDSLTEVTVDLTAVEIFLLLAAEIPS